MVANYEINRVGGVVMISVGIDVAKDKSTICAINPYGEILLSPQDYRHNKEDLNSLYQKLQSFKEDIHIVMEATGTYHLPIANYLKEKGFIIAIVNPLEMKRYRYQGIRNPKTDKIDALIIARYGIDFWYRKINSLELDEQREELRFLGMEYQRFMKVRTDRSIALCNIMDRTIPGVYSFLDAYNRHTGKDKLSDFAEEYWHREIILKYSEKKFSERYEKWAAKKGYRISANEASQLYALAKNGIHTLKAQESTHMIILGATRLLKDANASLFSILNRMQEIAKKLPEYETVLAMTGVGDTIGPRLMAEIGDPRRFHSAKALIAYAGIDAPPYQSGQFTGTKRHISKRGSKILRKIGFELITVLNTNKRFYADDPVCLYFMKKRDEGKHYRVAMFAAFNKFLRIYHARVSEVLNEIDGQIAS